MKDKRQQPHRDPLVTKHYRAMSTEESPERLDKAILTQANAVARPGYARLRMWSRPLGWAVTIALSIALVLQLTRAPEAPVSPEVLGPEPTTDASSDADELVPLDSGLLQEAEDMARMQSGPQQQPEPEIAYCDGEARSTRSAWLECIDKLESEGRMVEAEVERRAFELAFPAE